MIKTNSKPKTKISNAQKQQIVSEVLKASLPKRRKNKSRDNNRGPNDKILSQVNKGQSFGKALMSDPTIRSFYECYMHPFTKIPARLPIFPVSISQLVRVTVKGTGITNAGGNGFVMCTVANSVVNDLGCLAVSTAADAPNSFTAGGTGVTIYNSSSSYTQALFTPNFQPQGWLTMRPVSAGLRVRNIDTTLNSSGTCYCFQNEPRQEAINGYGIPQITQRPYKEYTMADRKWHAVSRHITDSVDFNFQYFPSDNQSDQWCYITQGPSATLSIDDYWNIGIFISAISGYKFEWEYVAHFEIKGRNLDRVGSVMPKENATKGIISSMTKLRGQDNTTQDVAPTELEIPAVHKEANKSSGGILGSLGKALNFGEKVLDFF